MRSAVPSLDFTDSIVYGIGLGRGYISTGCQTCWRSSKSTEMRRMHAADEWCIWSSLCEMQVACSLTRRTRIREIALLSIAAGALRLAAPRGRACRCRGHLLVAWAGEDPGRSPALLSDGTVIAHTVRKFGGGVAEELKPRRPPQRLRTVDPKRPAQSVSLSPARSSPGSPPLRPWLGGGLVGQNN